jgi:hypothetical protein
VQDSCAARIHLPRLIICPPCCRINAAANRKRRNTHCSSMERKKGCLVDNLFVFLELSGPTFYLLYYQRDWQLSWHCLHAKLNLSKLDFIQRMSNLTAIEAGSVIEHAFLTLSPSKRLPRYWHLCLSCWNAALCKNAKQCRNVCCLIGGDCGEWITEGSCTPKRLEFVFFPGFRHERGNELFLLAIAPLQIHLVSRKLPAANPKL